MKNKNNNKNTKIVCTLLGCLSAILLCTTIYGFANMKSASDKEYLALSDHLLGRFIEMDYGKDNRVCEMEKHELSKNNEVSVRFWCQDYDANTHEPVGDKEFHTLYFQHPREFEGGKSTGYAEALGE